MIFARPMGGVRTCTLHRSVLVAEVHKHSSMGCAVVSMQSANMREARATVESTKKYLTVPLMALASRHKKAIMNFAEQRPPSHGSFNAMTLATILFLPIFRFGRNSNGRVQMDIGDAGFSVDVLGGAFLRLRIFQVKVQLKRHTDKQTKREAG